MSSGKLNGTFNSSKYKALLSQTAVPISPVHRSSMIMDHFDDAGISSLS